HLLAVLSVDQEERWRRGQKIMAENYLARFPILRDDPILTLALIRGEYRLRQRLGETPDLQDYLGRFPEHVEALRCLGAEADEPPQLPGYEILGELGRGGMGVVYKARQLSLDRVVALKVILAGAHSSPAERARFKAEAEATARLRHPNIVQIYE